MKRALLALFSLIALGGVVSGVARAEEEPALLQFKAEGSNWPSVQRGARDFTAYCSGCHSMKYLRYSRMGADLGISDDLLKANLMFGTDKVGDTMATAMPAASEQWFGRVPPDLTLEAKARGSAWIYSYLLSFYLDDKRPLGVNNIYLPGVSMPHVLGSLQGWQTKLEASGEEEGGPKFQLVKAGSLSPAEYKAFVADITNFMSYAAEPSASDRVALGGKVMIYLLILLALCYFLKKEFWKDIH